MQAELARLRNLLAGGASPSGGLGLPGGALG